MRQDKKEERNRQKLAELFGLQEHVPAEPTQSYTIRQQNTSREAEAVLAYVDEPKKFTQRPCKWCESVFAADRGSVAYCSDDCRKHALAELGIVWDPNKDPRERWDFKLIISESKVVLSETSREPLTVPPPGLVVADLALEMKAQVEEPDVSDDSPESEPQPTPIVYSL